MVAGKGHGLVLMVTAAICGSFAGWGEAHAADGEKAPLKRELKGNRTLVYEVVPDEVESLGQVFEEGVFYGRLRTNLFYWDWDNESAGKDNYALGVGGSLIYRTARLHGFAVNAGIYTAQNLFIRMDREDIGFLKAGKDALSRNEVRLKDNYGFTVLGEANIDFSDDRFGIVAGRQLFESVYTKSNDTKMVPNTFDGVSLRAQLADGHTVRFAFFDKQKLRDHLGAHDVITFRDEFGNPWANQDDAAVHKGLSYDRLRAAGLGVKHDLFLAHYAGRFAGGWKLDLTGLAVPDLFSGFTVEVNRAWEVGQWKITPGIRLMKQIDEDAGRVGGASLSGNVNRLNPGGYDDPENADGGLIAVRLVLAPEGGVQEWLIGFSQVADDADLIAPWRGFPTGGYTRAMGQYNWRADTRSAMVQWKWNLGKAGLVKGLSSNVRFAMMDFDEAKGLTDRTLVHVDLTYVPPSVKNLEFKVRAAVIEDEGSTSYGDYRFETNFLF